MSEDEARAEAREQVESGFVSAVAERIGSAAGVAAVFGDPVERDGVTVIPVARAMWGAGGGGGESDEEGYGAGGGAMAAPHGFIEIGGGKVHYRRIGRPLPRALMLLGAALAGAGAAVLVQSRER